MQDRESLSLKDTEWRGRGLGLSPQDMTGLGHPEDHDPLLHVEEDQGLLWMVGIVNQGLSKESITRRIALQLGTKRLQVIHQLLTN